MQNFLKGFVYACNGLMSFFRYERNGKVQLCVAIIVVAFSWWLRLSKVEWLVVLGCIAVVLSLEMMNSAIEKLCNLVQPTYHPVIKTIKDISAGAVLWASIISTIAGLIIFLPKIFAGL